MKVVEGRLFTPPTSPLEVLVRHSHQDAESEYNPDDGYRDQGTTHLSHLLERTIFLIW